MSEDEIKELIKSEILGNMIVTVSITDVPYCNTDYYNVNVDIEYCGEKLNSYGDTIHVPKL